MRALAAKITYEGCGVLLESGATHIPRASRSGWRPDDSMEDVEEGAKHTFQDKKRCQKNKTTRPQPVQGADDEAVVQAADEVKLASFEQRIAELKDVGVKHLRLATRLLNRKEATVIAATSKRFARYRALQAPIFRIKTDGQKN